MFKSDVISFQWKLENNMKNPKNRGINLKSADYFLNIGMENYINSIELVKFIKTKEEINLTEKEK